MDVIANASASAYPGAGKRTANMIRAIPSGTLAQVAKVQSDTQVDTGTGKGWRMRNRLISDESLRHIAVALGYVVVYAAIHPFSDLMWSVPAGLRLVCLMLLPYRYWPALVAGEFVPVAFLSFQSRHQLGDVWAILNSVPPILIAAPLVWWCRERLALFPSKRLINVKTLIVCIAATSLIWTLRDLGIILVAVWLHSTPAFHLHAVDVVELWIGKYVGMLILVPIALVISLQANEPLWNARWRDVTKSPLTLDCAVLLLPALVLLLFASCHVSSDLRQLLRMMMFLPVVWMTVKHGWRATAIGGTLVVIGVSALQQARPDADVLPVQAFLAFAMTCLFAVGARITVLHKRERHEVLKGQRALKLAQDTFYRGELRMQHVAHSLEHAFGAMQMTHNTLLDRFRPLLPSSEGRRYTQLAARAQHTVHALVNAIQPMVWREAGLTAALRETLGRTLDEAGIVYTFVNRSAVSAALSSEVEAAIYRLTCEAIVHLVDQQRCESIRVTLRDGQTHGRRWSTVRINAAYQPPVSSRLLSIDATELASRLGATQLGMGVMRDQVQLYSGCLHHQQGRNGGQITALFHDHDASAGREPLKAPARETFYVN